MKKTSHIALLAVVIICSCFLFAACSLLDFDNNDSSNSSNSDNSSDDNTSQIVYIGETVKNSKGVEFAVLNVENTKNIGSNTTDNNFIIVTICISNNGSKTWEQNPNNCTLIRGSATYEYSSSTYRLDNGMSGFEEINPGISKTMRIVFETPTKSTEVSYSIRLSGYSIFVDDSVTILLEKRPSSV